MSEYKIQDSTLTSIANATRTIGNTQASLSTAQMTSILNNAYALHVYASCSSISVNDEDPWNPYLEHTVYAAFKTQQTGEPILNLYTDCFDTIVTHYTNTTAGTSGTLTDYLYSSNGDYKVDCGGIGSAGDSVTMYSVVSASQYPGFGTFTTSTVT